MFTSLVFQLLEGLYHDDHKENMLDRVRLRLVMTAGA